MIKAVEEVEADDVETLIKADLTDILKQVIDRKSIDAKLTHALISQLHDKDGRLIERIYDRLLKERLSQEDSVGKFMSPLHYNMMMQSAAVYRRHRLLSQLTLESTLLGVPVDTQSYIKTIIATHYGRGKNGQSANGSHPATKENLAYIY